MHCKVIEVLWNLLRISSMVSEMKPGAKKSLQKSSPLSSWSKIRYLLHINGRRSPFVRWSSRIRWSSLRWSSRQLYLVIKLWCCGSALPFKTINTGYVAVDQHWYSKYLSKLILHWLSEISCSSSLPFHFGLLSEKQWQHLLHILNAPKSNQYLKMLWRCGSALPLQVY